MKDDKCYFMKPESKEWDYMWNELANHPINKGVKDDPTVAENEYECWQYMDTSIYDGVYKHCFRHRYHPVTEQREYIHITANDNFMKSCE